MQTTLHRTNCGTTPEHPRTVHDRAPWTNRLTAIFARSRRIERTVRSITTIALAMVITNVGIAEQPGESVADVKTRVPDATITTCLERNPAKHADDGKLTAIPHPGTEITLVQKGDAVAVNLRLPGDGDLQAHDPIGLTILSSNGDREQVKLSAHTSRAREFVGSIRISTDAVASGDNVLQADRDAFVDAYHGTGHPQTVGKIQLGRLITPVLSEGEARAGRRVRCTPAEYEGSEVHHSLYLPTDWQPGLHYPVLVEYTGNKWVASGSTGTVADANLGYGLTGGKGFIWVVLPCVEKGRMKNALTWWGDLEATLDYCKTQVPRICERYGGDAKNVFLCGFSRGAIAVNYLGLADDEIAKLWKGFVAHDHYDGVFPVSDPESALERLTRLDGRPQLICSAMGTQKTRDYLGARTTLKNITFLDVPVNELFQIPDGKIVHPHTDLWMQVDSSFRQRARDWLQSVSRCPTPEAGSVNASDDRAFGTR